MSLFGNRAARNEREAQEGVADEPEQSAASEVSQERTNTRAAKLAGYALMGLPVAAVGAWAWFMFGGSSEDRVAIAHAAAAYSGGRSTLDLPTTPVVATSRVAAPPAGQTSAPPPGGSASAATPVGPVKREAGQLAVRKGGTGADAVLVKREATSAPAVTQVAATQDESNKKRAWVNRNMGLTIPARTAIQCVPKSPINTETRGPVECMVSDPVFAEDGTTELFPFGTMLHGYLGTGLGDGGSSSRRLFLAWDEARLPPYMGGARVPLTGVAASPLGENGVSGIVDTHLWERIRAGVLLTVLQGAVDAAVFAGGSLAADGDNNTFLNLGNRTRSTSNGIASQALQHDYNRPNTLRRPHAQGIAVKLVNDVDLSGVYEYALVRGNGR